MKIQHMPLAVLPLLTVLPLHAENKDTGRPNIVMFLIDDLGWKDFSCYGSKFYQTPTIDSLAREGIMFTNAYSSCTVSSPTRASLMTGKYPARLHLTDWISGWNYGRAKLSIPEWTKYLPLEEKTVAEYLKEAGYATWHIGKWHLGDDEKYWPENQGFDINIGGNYKGAPIKNKQGCGGYFSPYCLPRLENGPEGEYLTDRLTNEAVRLIEQNGGKPFFLNMAHYAVHAPLGAKPEILKKYEALADSSYFQNNATYAAMIQSVDESLRSIINALQHKGVLNNTLIIVTSDNGAVHRTSKSYPLRKGKGSEYEGGVRVPLIISWKGHTVTGKSTDEPAITPDLFSTILDAANVKTAEAEVCCRQQHVFDHARGVRKGDVRDFPDGNDDERGRSVYRVGGLVLHFFPRHFQKFGKRVFACDAADAQAVVSAHPDGRAERRRHDLSERGVVHGRAFKVAHRSSRFDAVESFHMFSPCPFL